MAKTGESDDTGPERRQRGRPRAFNEKTEQNTIKSLDRALVVLSELAQMESASLTRLAKRLDESPATVYRVLSTFLWHWESSADPVLRQPVRALHGVRP